MCTTLVVHFARWTIPPAALTTHLEDEGGTRTMAQATTTKLRPVPDRAPARPMAQAPTMKLRPLHDRVLVRRVEEQDDKHGSIIIPHTAKEKPQEGKVVAVGTGSVNEAGHKRPPAMEEGDQHLIREDYGNQVTL